MPATAQQAPHRQAGESLAADGPPKYARPTEDRQTKSRSDHPCRASVSSAKRYACTESHPCRFANRLFQQPASTMTADSREAIEYADQGNRMLASNRARCNQGSTKSDVGGYS